MNLSHRFIAPFLVAWMMTAAAAAFAAPTAATIMERNFYATKVPQISMDVVMTLADAQGQQRVRKMSVVSRLQPNGMDSDLLIRFSTPADIRGTGFLELQHIAGNDDIWVYLPALKKSRRLVSDNKKDSFFGSDFSYGDVLLPPVSDYRHTLVGTDTVNGHPCYVIESVPATDKARDESGYSKKISWIRQDNFVETKVEYYDLSGRLLKTQYIKQQTMVDPSKNRWIAQNREMVDRRTGHKTIMTVSRYDAQSDVPQSTFSIRILEQE